MNFFLLLNTKDCILKKMGSQTVNVHSMEKKYYGSQWGPSLLTNILQNIFFCVQQKKEIHTGLEQL